MCVIALACRWWGCYRLKLIARMIQVGLITTSTRQVGAYGGLIAMLGALRPRSSRARTAAPRSLGGQPAVRDQPKSLHPARHAATLCNWPNGSSLVRLQARAQRFSGVSAVSGSAERAHWRVLCCQLSRRQNTHEPAPTNQQLVHTTAGEAFHQAARSVQTKSPAARDRGNARRHHGAHMEVSQMSHAGHTTSVGHGPC